MRPRDIEKPEECSGKSLYSPSEVKDYFREVDQVRLNLFLDKLRLSFLDNGLTLGFSKTFIESFSKRNVVIYLLILANKYVDTSRYRTEVSGEQPNQDARVSDLETVLSLLIEEIENGSLPIYDFIKTMSLLRKGVIGEGEGCSSQELFHRSVSRINYSMQESGKSDDKLFVKSLKDLFFRLYVKNGCDKQSTMDEFYSLVSFSRFLSNRKDFYLQLDVSSSALVLCSLVLGVKDAARLNLSLNNFIKRDPYAYLVRSFFKCYPVFREWEGSYSLINRRTLKKPSMTIMYGSGQESTVHNLERHLFSSSLRLKKGATLRVRAKSLATHIYGFLFRLNGSHLYEDPLSLEKGFYYKNLSTKVLHRDMAALCDLKPEMGQANALDRVYGNFLENEFFTKPMSGFRDLADTCLMLFAGCIRINEEVVFLAYTSSLRRTKTSVSLEGLKGGDYSSADGKDMIRYSAYVDSLELTIKELFFDSF